MFSFNKTQLLAKSHESTTMVYDCTYKNEPTIPQKNNVCAYNVGT